MPYQKPDRSLNFNQRVASSLNWHLKMVMGARSTLLGSIYQTPALKQAPELTQQQREQLSALYINVCKIRDLLNKQEQLIRAYHTLPKKESHKC